MADTQGQISSICMEWGTSVTSAYSESLPRLIFAPRFTLTKENAYRFTTNMK
jgi:hypothetical protein